MNITRAAEARSQAVSPALTWCTVHPSFCFTGDGVNEHRNLRSPEPEFKNPPADDVPTRRVGRRRGQDASVNLAMHRGGVRDTLVNPSATQICGPLTGGETGAHPAPSA